MKLTKENILYYANKYDQRYNGTSDQKVEAELKKWFKKNHYLNRDKFIKLGKWKSRRQIKNYENNSDEVIREITKISLSTKSEQVRIRVLFVLNGVSWPVATVILHFAFPNQYAIMDFRAIWSLGWEQPKYYTYDFWKRYNNRMLELASGLNLSIRDIDKALWEYSKQNQ